jgi:phosphoglycolate phosphatase
MKDRFDLLVFDWDGTLFDSIGWIVHAIQRAAEDCGLEVPDDRAARSIIGLSLRRAMESLYPDQPPEMADQLATRYRVYYNAMDITPAGLFEGVQEMLEDLRGRGYLLAVATGKARKGLDAALRGTGIGGLFLTTRCADETLSKPDPRMLYEIMEELRSPSERTLMIGDSVHDLHMARNAGVNSVAVGCGANALEELAELEPLACVRATAELLRLLS